SQADTAVAVVFADVFRVRCAVDTDALTGCTNPDVTYRAVRARRNIILFAQIVIPHQVWLIFERRVLYRSGNLVVSDGQWVFVATQGARIVEHQVSVIIKGHNPLVML